MPGKKHREEVLFLWFLFLLRIFFKSGQDNFYHPAQKLRQFKRVKFHQDHPSFQQFTRIDKRKNTLFFNLFIFYR